MSRANHSIAKVAAVTAEARAIVDALVLQKVGETFAAPDGKSSVSVVDINSGTPSMDSSKRAHNAVRWARIRGNEEVVSIFPPTGSSATLHHPMLPFGSGRDLLVFHRESRRWLEPHLNLDLGEAPTFIDLLTTHCGGESFKAPDGKSTVDITEVNVGMDGARTNVIVWNRWHNQADPLALIPDPRSGVPEEPGADVQKDVSAFTREAQPWLEPLVANLFERLYGTLMSRHSLD